MRSPSQLMCPPPLARQHDAELAHPMHDDLTQRTDLLRSPPIESCAQSSGPRPRDLRLLLVIRAC
eukprot:6183010-Pleurochrysis_carterae.AAC.1